jgi:Tol biopolymer transport system component
LGAVLYEMLSGRRAFEGDTTVDVLANVLHGEPRELPGDLRVPAALDRIVRRCLEKRSEERFQSARDLAFALEGVASGSGTAGAVIDTPRRRVAWWAPAAAALVALAIGLGIGRLWRPSDAPAAPSTGAARFVFDAMRGQVPEVSISPNGRYLAWTEVMRGGRLSGLMVRRLDSEQSRLLTDTPATGPFFWSPDGREIVFVGEKSLVALDVDRGGRRVLSDFDPAALPLRGGDWLGQTLLLGISGTIWTQDLSGRLPRRQITKVDQRREAYHGWPALLPDGERFFYMVMLIDGGTETRIGSLTDANYAVKVDLPPSTSRVRPDERGYLVFGQNRVLMAQRVDFDTGAVVGAPVRLAPEVFHYPDTGWVAADVSRNSVLVWRSPGIDDAQFEWVDRGGRTLGLIGESDAYTNFDVSPDGARVVTVRRRGDTATTLFLMDAARNLTTPISSQEMEAPVSDPTWSPDGQQIAYRRGTSIVLRNVFGGEERVLRHWTGYPDSWSADNKYLLVGRPRGPDYQLWAVAMDGSDTEDIQLVQQLPLADEPRFSPDRKWVAFHAALQGAPQVFAIRFPPTGERWQLSTDGGVQPRWGGGGRELYYLDSNGQMMMVAMPNGDPTKARSPEPLFGLRLEPSTAFDQFAPVLDGQRFLVRRALRPGGADTGPVHVIVNWPESLPASTAAR